MERPKELRGIDDVNSFTYSSIVKRLPAILQQTLLENQFDPTTLKELSKIGQDILDPKGSCTIFLQK